jgi:metal-sulfur cluster biosynthetic enzyme
LIQGTKQIRSLKIRSGRLGFEENVLSCRSFILFCDFLSHWQFPPKALVPRVHRPRPRPNLSFNYICGTRNHFKCVPLSSREVFDLVRNINDPEHPLTLEQLNVIELDNVEVDDQKNKVVVHFTPTIPHCSMATLIGLAIRVKLLRSLPPRFKVLSVGLEWHWQLRNSSAAELI